MPQQESSCPSLLFFSPKTPNTNQKEIGNIKPMKEKKIAREKQHLQVCQPHRMSCSISTHLEELNPELVPASFAIIFISVIFIALYYLKLYF